MGIVLGLLLVLGALFAGPLGLVGTNFHPVVEGRVYRSAQLTAAELEAAIDRHGIRTIINLQGAAPCQDWYDAEVAVARARRVGLRDVALSSRRLPPQPAVVDLITWLETDPAPVLVHCNAGSDRSGLASALARILLEGASLEAARGELSLAYGHLPIGPGTEVDRFFDLYAEYLIDSGAPESPQTLRHWARERYVPYVYSARIETMAFPRSVRSGGTLDGAFRVTNLSPGPWQRTSSPERGITLGIRIRRDGASEWRDFDRGAGGDETVEAGESVDFELRMMAPRAPGRYWIKVDMVDEHRTWFEDQGSRAVELPLRVE